MLKTVVLIIAVILGQSGQDVFLVDAIQLPKYASSRAEKRQLKKRVAEYTAKKEELDAYSQEHLENFAKASENRKTTKAELKKLYDAFKYGRLKYISDMLDLRLQIQGLMSDEEWLQYVEHSYKQVKRPEISEVENAFNMHDAFEELHRSLNEVTAGSKYEAEAADLYSEFVHRLSLSCTNEGDRQLANGEILVRKDATRMQLQKVIEDQSLYYQELLSEFIYFREDLIRILSSSQWNAVSMQLSKLIDE